MSKFLFFLVGVIVLSKTDGTLISSKSSLTPDDSEEQFNVDDWSELDVVYPYSESFRVPEKRPNRDALMRRSTLDKNFMRFGRSGFFPGERCCRQKDLVGFADDYSSGSDQISLTKTGTDSNFMRFGRGGSDNFMRFGRPEKDKGNFMRFGRGGSDNFMRFGRGGGENFMRFGRSEKDKGNFMRFGRDDKSNFMRFGRDDKSNFMRFGRDDKSNFMRFGRDDRSNFMRFGRGRDDNFIRFGRGDDISRDSDESEEQFFRPAKNDQFIRFGRSPTEFVRYGKSDGKDSFIRFGKSGRNGTNFIRIGLESEEEGDGAKKDPSARRKRTTSDVKSIHERRIRNPEMMEDVLPETRRSSIEENVTKPNILKFISLINRNRPDWEAVEMKSFFPPAQSNPVLTPDPETKRKQDGSGFIRFG